MARWVYSIAAFRQDIQINVDSKMGYLDALNRDEANGKAAMRAFDIWGKEGWFILKPMIVPCDPEPADTEGDTDG